ncbi:MAG: glycosyltransferase 87 family protein [Candidatus Kapabacteria bacterium]|nr:glycosyltransferase 87 family protein [Candidatus Kapabacteria bacterium]
MHFDRILSNAGIAIVLWIPLAIAWLILVLQIMRAEVLQLQKFLRPLALIALVSVTLLAIPTDILSDDAFRYRWDGWVTSHGHNPYASSPQNHQPDLGTAWQSVAYGHMRTIYPPGAQLVFAGISLVAGTDPLLFKLGWLLLLAAMYVSLERLLRHNIRRTVLLRAMILCPVVLLNGLMDVHVDSAMALLTAIALVFFERRQLAPSAVIIAIAVSMKFVPIVALPFLFVSLTWRQRAVYSSIVVVILGIIYAPFIGPHMFDSLATFAGKWQTNSAPYLALSHVMDDTMIRLTLAAVALISVVTIGVRYRASPLFALSTSLTVIMLCSPVVHPWYLTLPLILFALSPTRAVIAWGVSMIFYGMGLLTYKGDGVWIDHPIALVLEFLPVISALAIDLRKGPLLFRYEHRSDRVATT